MPGSLNTSETSKGIIDKYSFSKSNTDISAIIKEKEDENDFAALDYFGFYHSKGLSTREYDVEKKYRKKDVKRVNKWMKFIQSYGFVSFYEGRHNEELIRRVFKGIPPPIRTRVWPLLLDVESAKQEKVYEDMRKYAFMSSAFIEQIDLDINRTFRSTTFFSEKFGPRQQALFRILSAYSIYNTEVGYCQGMSDIAGMLLIYIMDEEEAFWALAQLLNGPRHKMHCLFTPGFPGLGRYFTHHDRILRVHLSKVYKHFQKHQVEACTYAFKWYMQCFLGRLPISLTLRVWDIFLLEGEKTVVAMAYNILKMHRHRLLRLDQIQILTFLQDEMVRDFGFDDDDVIDSLKDCLEELRRGDQDTPPALTDDMLPSKPMGRVSTVWKTRHDDNHASQSATNQSNSLRHKPKVDSDTGQHIRAEDVVRADEDFQSGINPPSSSHKPPPFDSSSTPRQRRSNKSPSSSDSRRRNRGSQQSLNSSATNSTKPTLPHPTDRVNEDRSGRQENSHSTRNHSSERPAQGGPVPRPLPGHITPTSDRDKKLASAEENVWFIAPGTGYASTTDKRTARQHKQKTVDHPPVPERDYIHPPHAADKTPGSTQAAGVTSDSPWTRNPKKLPPPQTKRNSPSGDSARKSNSKPSSLTDCKLSPAARAIGDETPPTSPLWTTRGKHRSGPARNPPASQSVIYTNPNFETPLTPNLPNLQKQQQQPPSSESLAFTPTANICTYHNARSGASRDLPTSASNLSTAFHSASHSDVAGATRWSYFGTASLLRGSVGSGTIPERILPLNRPDSPLLYS